MKELATQLETALRPLMFQNRRRLRPAELREVAQAVAAAFQQALESPDGHTAAAGLGRQLAERGLGVPAALTLARVLRQSVVAAAPDLDRLEQAEQYTWHLLQGFFDGYETYLKSTLEGSIRAYQRLQQREES